MAKPILPEELWEIIEPLLPPEPPKSKGGRPRIANRAVLTGILFVLRSGFPWEIFLQEMGCGSGTTCWRRWRDWQEAGVWRKVHQVLLDRLGEADQVAWSRASLDSASVPAPGGGADTGPNPTDRGKSDPKRHVVVDRQGIPLTVIHPAANVHDWKMLGETMGDSAHQMSSRSAAKATGQAARRQSL